MENLEGEETRHKGQSAEVEGAKAIKVGAGFWSNKKPLIVSEQKWCEQSNYNCNWKFRKINLEKVCEDCKGEFVEREASEATWEVMEMREVKITGTEPGPWQWKGKGQIPGPPWRKMWRDLIGW